MNGDLAISAVVAIALHAGAFAVVRFPAVTAPTQPGERVIAVEVTLAEVAPARIAVAEPVVQPVEANVALNERRHADLNLASPAAAAFASLQPTVMAVASERSLLERSAPMRAAPTTVRPMPAGGVDAIDPVPTFEVIDVTTPAEEQRKTSPPAQQTMREPQRAQSGTAPIAVRNPQPMYPSVARRRGWEGVVELRVEVCADGSVGDVFVLTSSGRSTLDDAAMRAVEKWTFTPATRNGEPVARFIRVPIEFRLIDR